MWLLRTITFPHLPSSSRSPTLRRRHQLIDGVRIVDTQMVRLQTPPAKTHERIWFGTAAILKHIKNIDLTLHGGNDVIKPISVGCDLGVPGTIHETTHLQGDQYLFLPSTKIEASLTYTRSRHHHQPHHRLRFKSIGLF